MKRIAIIIVLLTSFNGWAQLKLKKNGNSTLSIYNRTHSDWNLSPKLLKWQKKDTLSLPFFDDFVSTTVYPDSTRWFDNDVFINNDFPIKPPSYGVATFDDLDSKGNPYQELNDQTYGACDTLTSLAINLKDSSGKFYSVADSIILSFYIQRQGIGDPSDNKDSLILQFKDKNNQWNTQWKAKGGSLAPFAFIMTGIKDLSYFFKGFQFRFINFSRHTGNLNQWHLDYIHLARKRKMNIKNYDDIAIQSRPSSLLKNYFQMPYQHFQADSAQQKAKLIFVNANNLHNSIKNVQAKHTETINSVVINATNFNSNNANILAQDSAKRRFEGFSLNNLSGSPIVIKREYEIRESGIASKYAANDKITVFQEFGSCYAYDDGTAEYGFGYDDDVIDPNYKGAIAYKFNLIKSDSLWAIGMFFNRSIKSTSNLKFDLKIWQKISPLGQGRGKDETVITQYNLTPKFTDSLNGYHLFYLDSSIVLPKGDFYIGWEQEGNTHLDIGYDINNGHHETESSQNLFWLDRGNWAAVDFKGALMMRPYIGKRLLLGPGSIKPNAIAQIIAYPNPFTSQIVVSCKEEIAWITLSDITGKIKNTYYTHELDVSMLNAGIYAIRISTKSGKIFNQKMVKLQ